MRSVDRSLAETQQYIEHNLPRIELAEKNNRTREEIEREKQAKYERQEKLAVMVNDFNHYMDEERYPEAEVVAKRAAELDPKNPIVEQLNLRARMAIAFHNSMAIKLAKEDGVNKALTDVDRASIPFDTENPYIHGDLKEWSQLSKNRSKLAQDRQRRRSEQEMEIEKKLKTPVSVAFHNRPLSQVMDELAKLADVNLHLDPEGLQQEGISSDTPVSIEIRHEVMLKSALNLILEPLHLSYVVKDEVLKITSEQRRAGQVYAVTYNVADLVMPIPNFTGGPNMGLEGGLSRGHGHRQPEWRRRQRHDEHATGRRGQQQGHQGQRGDQSRRAGPDGRHRRRRRRRHGRGRTAQRAHRFRPRRLGRRRPGRLRQPHRPDHLHRPAHHLGCGGRAGLDRPIRNQPQPGHQPDAGSPRGNRRPAGTVAENAGPASHHRSPLHHAERKLLRAHRRGLRHQHHAEHAESHRRRLQPHHHQPRGQRKPAITAAAPTAAAPRWRACKTSATARRSQAVYTSDLDIPFSQSSFAKATPQFGGFDATAGARSVLPSSATWRHSSSSTPPQGDIRSNVLQAPKVTLFNGQQAFVSDTSQTPFVISVIPVVGDFAAAQQPVIVVLSEGTFMTVQAVVSNDRRFVRLTIVPFFSKITAVNDFTFQGSQTTTTDTTRNGLIQQNLFNNNQDTNTSTTSGTTVQLPTFSFVTVTTTVSVPDGGTVLLGGIKRLSEGRNEYGVPILDKIPYLNRLFKNVGIGRDTSSLMMMVTPRIIIQEEEEEKLGIAPP